MFDEVIYFLSKCIKSYKRNVDEATELLDIINKGEQSLPPYGIKNILNADIDQVEFITYIYFISSLSGTITKSDILDYDELREKIKKVVGLATTTDDSIDGLLENLSEIYRNNETVKPIYRLISKALFPKGVDSKTFYELLKKNPAGILNSILMLRDIRELKQDHEMISQKEGLSSKHKRILTEIYDDVSDADRLKSCIEHYKEHTRAIVKNLKQYNKEYNNKIKRYEFIISELEKGSITSPIIFEKIYNSFDEDIEFIRDEFMKNFMSSIAEEINGLKEKIKELHADDSTKYISLLHDYGINFNAFSDKEQRNILKHSIESIELRLKLYKLLNLTDISMILQLPDELIITYSQDIANNILNKDFLKSNSLLFTPKYYENYLRIKEIFISKDFNPLMFLDHSYLFIIDANIVEENLNILEEYDLLSLIKNTSNLNFLSNNDLGLKIDLLIESGYEYSIEDNLDILNYSYESLTKLLLLKELDEFIQDREELIKYLDRENSLVLNRDINNYLFDYSLLIPDSIKELLSNSISIKEKFNARLFAIGNVLVSNRRFINNINKLADIKLDDNEKRFYAVIYGSHYTYDEVLEIANYFQIDINNINKKSK